MTTTTAPRIQKKHIMVRSTISSPADNDGGRGNRGLLNSCQGKVIKKCREALMFFRAEAMKDFRKLGGWTDAGS